MKLYVGTSGWYYDWNKDKTLDWYIEHSSLNAVELNASFYRFPFPNQIKSWARKGRALRWVIKVNRLITHQYKFSAQAIATWHRFYDAFATMHTMIDYFLFQLPPYSTPTSKRKIEVFFNALENKKQCALEPRHEAWFDQKVLHWAQLLGITWVSIDAPEYTRDVFKTTADVYVRMHGRTAWYRHDYTKRELKDVAQRIIAANPRRAFVFFNNDHAMLRNAQSMKQIFGSLLEA
jgi:uncharacterized protein YecE (DUF72 family)